jgi:hypothetical protein
MSDYRIMWLERDGEVLDLKVYYFYQPEEKDVGVSEGVVVEGAEDMSDAEVELTEYEREDLADRILDELYMEGEDDRY